jgi:hypothetical protein
VQKTPTEVDVYPEVDKNREVDLLPPPIGPEQLALGAVKTPVLSIEVQPTPQTTASPAAVFSEIRASIQRRVNPHSFETWFSPLRAESLSDDRLRVRVPREMWMKRMHETYGAALREALTEIKRPQLTLEFVVGEVSFDVPVRKAVAG